MPVHRYSVTYKSKNNQLANSQKLTWHCQKKVAGDSARFQTTDETYDEDIMSKLHSDVPLKHAHCTQHGTNSISDLSKWSHLMSRAVGIPPFIGIRRSTHLQTRNILTQKFTDWVRYWGTDLAQPAPSPGLCIRRHMCIIAPSTPQSIISKPVINHLKVNRTIPVTRSDIFWFVSWTSSFFNIILRFSVIIPSSSTRCLKRTPIRKVLLGTL